jgi:hypothetical protein
MLNLQVGELLIRKKEKTGIKELDELIGVVLRINKIAPDEIETDIACPHGVVGKVILVNNPEVLEELFDSQPMCVVDKPQDINMDPDDWLLLCLLFQRYTPSLMQQAADSIAKEIVARRGNVLVGRIVNHLRPREDG